MKQNGETVIRGNQADGSLDVNIQDQVSAPVASTFVRSISTFSLATDSASSTTDTLVYDFTATAGHGIISGNEIILLDTAGNRELIAVVTNVATNTITIDRPIDHVFPSASTLGRIISSDIAVDGSTTPIIFTMRAGAVPVDIQTIVFTLSDDAAMDDGKFAGGTALSNGLVFRIVDGYQKTLGVMKTNGNFRQYGANVEYVTKTGGGGYAVTAKFNVKDVLGVVFRVSSTSVIQVIVQDDLTGLSGGHVTALGQETVGEEL